MIDSTKLWEKVHQKNPHLKERGLQELIIYLGTVDCPHARLLTGQAPSGEMNAASVQHLEISILEHTRQRKMTQSIAKQWFTWIQVALKHAPNFLMEPGVKLDIHPIKFAKVPCPTTSPFSPANTKLAGPVMAWTESFIEWLADLKDKDLTPDEWTAGMAISSILIGGLLEPTKVKALLLQITSDLPTIGQRPYAEFHQSMGRFGDFHCQRWFLDPVSELLYYRRPFNLIPISQGQLAQAIQKLLQSDSNLSVQLPANLNKLADHAKAWWAQRAPRVDIEIIDRRIIAHSIHEKSWNRLFRLMPVVDVPGAPVEVSLETDLDSDFQIDFDLLHPWFPVLLQALTHPPKTLSASINIPDFFAESEFPLSTLSDIPKLFVHWVIEMLMGKNCTYNFFAVSTIRHISQVVIPALISRLQGLNPVDLTSADFVDLYESIVDSKTGSERVTLAKGLREFHHFLSRKYKVAPLNSIREVLGDDAGLAPVDANPISVEEYLAAKDFLSQQIRRGGDSDLLQISKLVMMLAFRTGMRRREAMGLRLKDLDDLFGLDILVRPHEKRKLKSDASQRSIPARYLLPLKERREFQVWLERRFKGANPSNHNAWVFDVPNPKGGWRRLSIETTADRIIAALSHATGQPTKIHQLRHAFSTWMYLALRTPDYPEVLHLFDHLPQTKIFLKRGRRFRKLLLKRSGVTSREYGYAVARLLGHSTPMVSLNCYIHSTEFIHRALSIRSASELPSESLRGVANLKPSWGNRLLKDGLENILNHARKRWIDSSNGSLSQKPESPQITTGLQETVQALSASVHRGRTKKVPLSDWTDLMTVHELLHVYSSTSQAIEDICKQVDLSLTMAQCILKQAQVHGKAFGFNERGIRSLAYPEFARNQSVKDSALILEGRLKRVFSLDPDSVLTGIKIHLENYNINKRDVVFKGRKEVGSLVKYVTMLNRMEYQYKDMQIVLRSGEDGTTPAWAKRPLKGFAKSAVVYNSPPVPSKASSYLNWVGLRPTIDGNIGSPGSMRGIFFLFFLAQQAKCEINITP